MSRTIISGGAVVTETAIVDADIIVESEKIVAIVERVPALASDRVIDASGCYVLPGVVDPHVHCTGLSFYPYAEDIEAVSRSAAFGGVTTILSFLATRPPSTIAERIRQAVEDCNTRSYVDYSLHAMLLPNEEQAQQIPEAVDLGVTSFKAMMHGPRSGLMVPDNQLLEAMEFVAAQGAVMMVHAESGEMIDYLERKLVAQGNTGRQWHLPSRPILAEVQAVSRAIALSRLAGCRLYIVHLSSSEALSEIDRSKETLKQTPRRPKDCIPSAQRLPQREPVEGCLGEDPAARVPDLTVETCPQYLLLTDGDAMEQGALARVVPPLRSSDDNESLWRGIADGRVHTVGSDHCPIAREKKEMAGENIFAAPAGMPGIETSLALLYSEGVVNRKISVVEMAKVLSTNAARVFGLYPRKGAIKIGADADLVIFDPNESWTVSAETLHGRAGFTCFEGWNAQGKPRTTLLRGEILLENGRLSDGVTRGKFLPRARAV